MSDRVTLSVDGGVADVRLNRPDKMNAVDSAMFDALVEAGLEVARNRAIRAVVLSGAGRAFCAGLDVSSFGAMASSDRSGGGGGSLFQGSDESPANRAQRAAWIWTEVPIPVIAAIHGVAFGAGLQIACAADIRFIAPDARMSIMESKWGLVPDMAATQTLRRLLRLDVLKELTYTARAVNGAEAVDLGLATHVSDKPLEAAFELAREIANRSPDAIRAAKTLLDETGRGSVSEGLALEAKLQAGLIGKPNQIEAVKSNLEKRAPQYRDPE